MKCFVARALSSFAALTWCLLIAFQVSLAAEFRSDDRPTVKTDEVIDDDLYIFGDEVTIDGTSLLQKRWRMFRDADVHPVVRDQWLALFEGMLGVHDRFLRLVGEQMGAGFKVTIQ